MLTYGFLRNVQVAVQQDMANMLSISPFPVTNGADVYKYATVSSECKYEWGSLSTSAGDTECYIYDGLML